MTPIKGKRDAIGSISLESRGADRLSLGFGPAPDDWGKGLTTEAAQAMIDAGFGLTPAVEILASVRVENEASRAVIEKCGFALWERGRRGRRRAGAWSSATTSASPAPIGPRPRRSAARRRPPWRARDVPDRTMTGSSSRDEILVHFARLRAGLRAQRSKGEGSALRPNPARPLTPVRPHPRALGERPSSADYGGRERARWSLATGRRR